MREGHALGLRTTATMVFGFGETAAHVVNHLELLRALQDQTSGFTAFICWPFQPRGPGSSSGWTTPPPCAICGCSRWRVVPDNFPA